MKQLKTINRTKIYLCILMIIFSSNVFSQVEVTERLANKMNSLNPLQYTGVLILLKDRVDIEQLDKDLYEMKASTQYRAEVVINTLREKAKQTQTPVLEYLGSQKQSGKIKKITSYWISNMIFAEATPDVINSLTMRTDIDQMDLDAELEMEKGFDGRSAADNAESVETGIKIIKADSLWRLGITGAGRTVMNIDGGVNVSHPALKSKWWGNNGRKWYHSWFNAGNPVSTYPHDCSQTNHGTHTMGIICGMDNTKGDTVGVAPDAYWIAAANCPLMTSDVILNFQWAMDPDTNAATMDMPDVINCSWYDINLTNECTSVYINTLVAVEAAGIAVIWAAGNFGPQQSTITPPKNISVDSVNTFTVGNFDGSTFLINNSSSRGPSICGGTGSLLIKPEVCAPGTNIRSTWTDSSYHYLSGTSMAAPHVAGCIALLKQAAPDLTGKQLKAILYTTATDLGAAGEDNTYGKGLVNVLKAFQMLKPSIQHAPLLNTENLDNAYTVNCTILPTSSGIDPSKTKLFWSRNNTSVTNSMLMTNTNANTWTADIPADGTAATYRYYIQTTDSTNKTSYFPAGAQASPILFVAQTDNSKPVIVHTALGKQARLTWPSNVTATITDNLGLDSAWVVWFKNSPANLKQFKIVKTFGNDFSSAFNSLNSDVSIGDSIFYRIFAQDNSIAHNSDSTALLQFKITEQILCENFTSTTYPPVNWKLDVSEPNYWTRSNFSSYGAASGSSKFDFFNANVAEVRPLYTLEFEKSVAGDSLMYDYAYASHTNSFRIDSLTIETSTDGGISYTLLVRLKGGNLDTIGAINSLKTAASQSTEFTPASNQWRTRSWLLPPGTNKIKFRARSSKGNNLYLDNICKVKGNAPAISSITFAAQGYFDTVSSRLSIRDSATFYLRNIAAPYSIVDSAVSIIDSISLTGTVMFVNAPTGVYYVIVKGRNILETWSKGGGENYNRNSAFNYDFTTSLSQAYEGNMIQMGSKYCIYSGDVVRDNAIELEDLIQIYNDASTFGSGFIASDLTGDRIVDLSDILMVYNNSNNFVTRKAPSGVQSVKIINP